MYMRVEMTKTDCIFHRNASLTCQFNGAVERPK
jgi:hypothetical protein